MSEAERFRFLCQRDGLEAALEFERENVIRTYRKVVVGRKVLRMYRRQLIEAYVEAKRIVAGCSGSTTVSGR